MLLISPLTIAPMSGLKTGSELVPPTPFAEGSNASSPVLVICAVGRTVDYQVAQFVWVPAQSRRFSYACQCRRLAKTTFAMRAPQPKSSAINRLATNFWCDDRFWVISSGEPEIAAT
jgi:hypothetical protein